MRLGVPSGRAKIHEALPQQMNPYPLRGGLSGNPCRKIVPPRPDPCRKAIPPCSDTLAHTPE